MFSTNARWLLSGIREPGRGNRKPTALSMETLEPRTVCATNQLQALLSSLEQLGATSSSSSQTRAVAAATLASQLRGINVLGGTQVTSQNVQMSVLGRDDKMLSDLSYNWRVTESPSGSTPKFSTNNNSLARNTTLTLNRPGLYNVRVTVTDKKGVSTIINQRLTVAQTRAETRFMTGDNRILSNGIVIDTTNPIQRITSTVLDQFGRPHSVQPSQAWLIESSPSGSNPTVSVKGQTATVTFNQSGLYRFRVESASGSFRFSINVAQRVAKINVTPGAGNIAANATQQFSASAYDQFNKSISAATFNWSASTGSIDSAGLFTAPSSSGSVTISARSGTAIGSATFGIVAQAGLQDPSISQLVYNLAADGSISRTDMMSILRSTGSDGVVSALELGDLKYIISNATYFNIAPYVQTLAGNVVQGNRANATYLGLPAGNLSAGSTASLLTSLVDKWFLGTDLPVLTGAGIAYQWAAGKLFNGNPLSTDQRQGQLGDCYFIASLGALAANDPQAITNMFIDNGDNTYTVRFYTGNYGAFYLPDGTISDGFTTGLGTADYVTVNEQLPTYSNGMFAYSNYGLSINSTSAPLWIALAEKAYAQWNQTGRSGRDGTNSYAGIEGGWMATVNAQILGYNASDYMMTSATKQTLVNALSTNQSVTIGTKPTAGSGLVGSHAYSVTGYNPATDTFTLYNPWGTAHPGPLTWSQLQTNCSMFVVANPSGGTPIITNLVSNYFTVTRVNANLLENSLIMTSKNLNDWQFSSDSSEGDWYQSTLTSSELVMILPSTTSPNAPSNDWSHQESDNVSSVPEDRGTGLTPELVDAVLDQIDALLEEALS